MTKVIIVCWAICLALAISHLLFLAAYTFAPGFWLALAFVLACYSLPFFMLTRLKLPADRPLKRILIVTLVAIVIAINAFIPITRFLPGYRPDALESLIYLVVPILECLPIGLALAIL